MMLTDLIDICEKFSGLGWAIQRQLEAVLNDDMGPNNINVNALTDIEDFLNFVAYRVPDYDDVTIDVTDLLERIEAFRAGDYEDEDK